MSIQIMLLALTPVSVFEAGVSNLFFTNLSSANFDTSELTVLGLGLNFIPTLPAPVWSNINAEYDRFARRIFCHDFFSTNSIEPRDDLPPPGCERFRIPNPDWNPDTSNTEWQSSCGVKEYVEETRGLVHTTWQAATARHDRPVFNLSRRHREALARLRLRDDVVFVDADKNLGLVCLDRADYVQQCTAELAQTHTLCPPGMDPLSATQAEIRDTVFPPAGDLPKWAARWVSLIPHRHPRGTAAYCIPNFRTTPKVHKQPVQGRPITGNQRWITQPLAELLANLLQPFVTELPVFTQDTDQINRLVDDTHVPGTDFLLTYDIVRLYPSIPHDLCYVLIRRHLAAQKCPHTDFIIAALKVVLNFNFCRFDGRVYRQFIGFATGIACGAEVANLFIFVLTRFVFYRHRQHIRLHRRYIDDGFMIWRGTAAQAAAMMAELNAICPDIQLTHELSRTAAIFLDLKIFKGPQWRRTGRLDTKVYQKPMNRYLYTPHRSEHPRHCFRGIVHGELRRYIKRSTAREDFLAVATQLRHRLSMRGYTEKFLADAFASAPRYDNRADYLAPRAASRAGGDSPVIVFSTTYSTRLQNSKLSRAIFLHRDWLPRHFADVEFLTAWKVGRKIGGRLVSFSYPKPRRESDPLDGGGDQPPDPASNPGQGEQPSAPAEAPDAISTPAEAATTPQPAHAAPPQPL